MHKNPNTYDNIVIDHLHPTKKEKKKRKEKKRKGGIFTMLENIIK
jgi:hypothetical protein